MNVQPFNRFKPMEIQNPWKTPRLKDRAVFLYAPVTEEHAELNETAFEVYFRAMYPRILMMPVITDLTEDILHVRIYQDNSLGWSQRKDHFYLFLAAFIKYELNYQGFDYLLVTNINCPLTFNELEYGQIQSLKEFELRLLAHLKPDTPVGCDPDGRGYHLAKHIFNKGEFITAKELIRNTYTKPIFQLTKTLNKL